MRGRSSALPRITQLSAGHCELLVARRNCIWTWSANFLNWGQFARPKECPITMLAVVNA